MDENQTFDMDRILKVNIEEEMKTSYINYSMSVIVARALPDVRDGFKPVHRRILFGMLGIGNTSNSPYKKCARVVGEVLGKYHPHGDSSVYGALVRMGQDWNMRYMLVDGHGNFGSVDGDSPAAMRYTECRLSKMGEHIMDDLEKDTVDMVPNFDGTLAEPSVMPTRIPNLLVNGGNGIAVGMATNIPTHNLSEVIDGCCAYIDNPDIDTEGLMQFVKAPDFPTGAYIYGLQGVKDAYETGRGRIVLRAKSEIESGDTHDKIVVTEIPYGVNKAQLVENIADLVKDKRIEGISNIEDHSDRKGMHIEIDIKRDASPQIVLNQLFSYTQLQTTFGAIMLSIVDGEPKILSLKEMLQCYIEFQAEVIRRRTDFDLKKARDRAHILEGLKIALDFIDEVIKIIRNSKDTVSAKAGLMERFGLDDVQAQAIVQMRLGQLTNMEQTKIEDEIAALHAKIEEYLEILASEPRQLEIVKEEIMQIRNKYADPRRTEICAVSGEVDIEDLIPQEECVLTLTQFGYVKRLSADTYKIQRRGGRGVSGMSRREEDIAAEMFVINSHDYVLFFTDKGRVYRLKCYEVPEGSRQSKGVNIANLIPISPDEKVTSMIRVPEFDEEKYLVMVTRQGIIKRIELNAYNTSRKGGLIALELNEGDELTWVRMTDGNSQVIIATKKGMAIRFNETDIRSMGRQARGVKAMALKEGDCVVGMSVVREGGLVLTVSETGYGRLSSPDDYRVQSRGGKGLTNYHTEKYGDVAAIKVVNLDDDIIIISEEGIIIRIAAESIRVCARPSKGVTVMKVNGDDRVVTIARVPHIDGEDDESAESEDNAENGEPSEAVAEEVSENNEGETSDSTEENTEE